MSGQPTNNDNLAEHLENVQIGLARRSAKRRAVQNGTIPDEIIPDETFPQRMERLYGKRDTSAYKVMK